MRQAGLFLSGCSDSFIDALVPDQQVGIFSDIEEEVHDVAVPDDIVLALDAELAGGAACRFGFQFDEVFVFDDLCADEAFLEV